MNTTNEMRKIADGLGSGVSPEQVKTSIEYGATFLQEIKDIGKLTIYDFLGDQIFNNIKNVFLYHDIKIRIYYFTDFSDDRKNAEDSQQSSRDLVSSVTEFSYAGTVFKDQVSDAESKRAVLDSKLEDLKNRSQNAGEKV